MSRRRLALAVLCLTLAGAAPAAAKEPTSLEVPDRHAKNEISLETLERTFSLPEVEDEVLLGRA